VREGKLHCDGAEREAIDLMASLVNQLEKEKSMIVRRNKRGAA
jgi:hypothetical protein